MKSILFDMLLAYEVVFIISPHSVKKNTHLVTTLGQANLSILLSTYQNDFGKYVQQMEQDCR